VEDFLKRILILCEGDDCLDASKLPLAAADAVVAAFSASPEYLEHLSFHGARQCLSLSDLGLRYRELVARAYTMVREFVFHCPSYRGVNVLETYETELANALFAPLVMSAIHNMLQERFGTGYVVRFLADNDGFRAFQAVNGTTTPRCEISVIQRSCSKARPAGLLVGLSKLAAEARFDHNWVDTLASMIDQLDHEFVWRARFDRCRKVSSGGALLFSSYVNYSRALTQHASAMGSQAQWLVSNHSARKALPGNVDPVRLWQFLPTNAKAHIPVIEAIPVLLANLPELVDEFPLRAALMASSYVRSICSAVVPFFLSLVDLMHNALDEIQPDSVWVANQWGPEACLIQAARSRGIHVTQVQHGIMESYYSCAPVYSDELLVWDELWGRFVPRSEQDKVQVKVIEHESISRRSIDARNRRAPCSVTLFGGVPDVVPLWNPSIFVWESVVLMERLASRGHKLIMRVHPRDRIQRYVEAWRRLYGSLPSNVVFDKYSPLVTVLEKTDVGVTTYSTTILNCRASDIPVFGMGWYEFMLKELLSEQGTQYCQSIGALVNSIESASQTRMPAQVT